MRTSLTFPHDSITLVATLDIPDESAATGLLIVTGGTEIRSGAHGGLADLAGRVAARGFPVFRYDRRGVGDSEGDDPGFAASQPDLVAAAAAFRASAPSITHIAGFGLCDGASALALHHASAGIDALMLVNPWVVVPTDGLPPAAAIRRRYRERLTSREGWRRLMTGRVDLSKLARGLRAAGSRGENGLAESIARALTASPATFDILLAQGDATAIAFEAAFARPAFTPVRARARVHRLDSASHSFAGEDARIWLADRVIAILER